MECFIFTGDLGQLLRGVMAEAKDLAGAERCSLFLVDKDTGELVSKVFDGDEVKVTLFIDSPCERIISIIFRLLTRCVLKKVKVSLVM